jgi:type II secretory pathway component PulJ
MEWLRKLLVWLDRPHHTDWRPTVDFKWRRWHNGRWEYRDMAEDEARHESDLRAW